MTPVNADDLPAAVRSKLGLPAAGRTRSKPSRKGEGLTGAGPWRCGAKGCGLLLESWPLVEAHARQFGHGRVEIPLPTEGANDG